MELIVTNVTDREIDILEKEDFDWYPDSIYTRDIVLAGTKSYINKVLRAIGRIQ